MKTINDVEINKGESNYVKGFYAGSYCYSRLGFVEGSLEMDKLVNAINLLYSFGVEISAEYTQGINDASKFAASMQASVKQEEVPFNGDKKQLRIIVEGASGSGKTQVIDLIRSAVFSSDNPMISKFKYSADYQQTYKDVIVLQR